MSLCPFCLKRESSTQEHVLPKSYYLRSDVLADVQRWTTPSCQDCNTKAGNIEQKLLTRLGSTVDPANQEFGDILANIMRSMDPNAARTPSQIPARTARKNAFLNDLIQLGQWPSGDPKIGVKIPREFITALGAKIAIGLEASQYNKYIANMEINIELHTEKQFDDFLSRIPEKSLTYHTWGNSIKVYRATASAGQNEGFVHYVNLWSGTIYMSAGTI